MKRLIRFGPHTGYQKKQVIDAIENLVIEEKKDYEVVIKPYKLSKSAEQLGYYFTVIVPFCAAWMGEDDLKSVHLALKDKCLVFVRHFKNFAGETKETRPTIKDLKVNEMAEYITSCVQFLGMNGVKVPPPVRRGE
tara:strand:- start:119 stop:526 length:408 start_codon:yes stop_codon:yes gene_type:complete